MKAERAVDIGLHNPTVAYLSHFRKARSMNPGWVYIVANKPQGVLYVGVTSDLEGRISEHRNHVQRGFTDSYNCTRLVWYEDYSEITDAIQREKQLKHWKREWKIQLIEEMNPEWEDLFETIMW